MNKILSCVAVAVVSVFSTSDSFAGRKEGPLGNQYTVEAKSENLFSAVFRDGQPAIVIVKGTSGDIDCVVMDQKTNPVAKDFRPKISACMLTWNPIWEGVFHVGIVNDGDEPVTYTLTTN